MTKLKLIIKKINKLDYQIPSDISSSAFLLF